MTHDVTYRMAVEDDFVPTWSVFTEAADDLALKHSWPAAVRPPSPPARFLGFRRSAIAHDPGGFWVAEADGRLVGFGIAVAREHVWYLAALHVRPAFQSHGVGTEIVRRCLEVAPRHALLTVGADARNPVSNALYGRFGMFAEQALLEMSGPVWSEPTPGAVSLRPGLPNAEALDALDRATLAAARPEDHAFWSTTPNLHAFAVVREGADVGYAYVQADGAIGPIAVARPDDLPAAMDHAVAAAASFGATAARVRIPGVARTTVSSLLDRRWRYGDAVTLVLTSAPWGRWEGYVTSGADALL